MRGCIRVRRRICTSSRGRRCFGDSICGRGSCRRCFGAGVRRRGRRTKHRVGRRQINPRHRECSARAGVIDCGAAVVEPITDLTHTGIGRNTT